jgi:very-short-patch-repair endonuclease
MRVAAAQDGAVSAAQLAAAGLSRGAIAHRVADGRLERVHRGVYVMGPVRGPWCAEWAAILACGPWSALSHWTALALCGLAKRPEIVHVSRPAAVSFEGVRGHRATIGAEDRAVRHGLPITRPARTLLDLAPYLPAVELQRLVEEALLQRLTTHRELHALAERSRGRAGVAQLRAVLRRDDEPKLTRSEAERRLLALIRAARLPVPATNARVGGFEVDALRRDERLIVEVDGFAFHSSRAAFERDRRRDAHLTALGHRVIRVTWRQLAAEPEAVIATIAAALSAARSA